MENILHLGLEREWKRIANESKENYNLSESVQVVIENPNHYHTSQNWKTEYLEKGTDFNDRIRGKRANLNSSKQETINSNNNDLECVDDEIKQTTSWNKKQKKRKGMKNEFVKEYDKTIIDSIFQRQVALRKISFIDGTELNKLDLKSIQKEINLEGQNGKMTHHHL